ncbi:MAG: hypothetical protein ABIP06_12300 [Pyrinomonadaceae bacterium]
MTKREVVWLLIRLAGIYFAYLAIITIFTVVTSSWSVIFAPPKLDLRNANANHSTTMPEIQSVPYDPNFDPNAKPIAPTATEQIKPEDKAKREVVMSFLGGLLLALIYSGLGFYFLREGRILYAILMREESDRVKNSEPEVTSLNL